MKQAETSIWCPISGCIKALSEVEDPMFRQEMLGPTICVEPIDDMVYAPFDGIISVMYPSSHAVGIKRDDGLEVLIHVGIDTVTLEGIGFQSQVKQGAYVKRKQALLKFDTDLIKRKGYSTKTFIVFTNDKEFIIKKSSNDGQIKVKDVLCYAEKI